MTSSTIQSAAAAFDGGALYLTKTVAALAQVVIQSCRATQGAGIFASVTSQATAVRLSLQGNVANSLGGGLYADRGVVVSLSDSLVVNNAAGESGGGLFATDADLLNLVNAQISNNTAFTGAGAALQVRGERLLLEWVCSSPVVSEIERRGGCWLHD